MRPADPSPAAVSALVAVTSCPVALARPAESLQELLATVVRAAGARVGVVWEAHPREAGGRVVAAAGGPGAEPLAAAIEAEGLPSGEALVGPGDGGPLAEAAARAGVPHALLLPAGAGEGPIGVCVLAAEAPPADDPLLRHALRVGAQRVGALLDARRLRESLDRAMAQILSTDERMLGRIGLDIHDGPTQQLSVALLEVQLLEAELGDGRAAGPEVREALGRIYETVGGALHEMRELIGHLRPAQFEDRGLADILRDAIVAFEARTDCPVHAGFEGEFPVNGVSVTQRITFYRILQETLANAHRHGAASEVRVTLSEDEAGTTLEVRDDGGGFDPEAVPRRSPSMPLARFGLHGMRDRAQFLGGRLDVESAPGEGTTVRVFLPRWPASTSALPVDVA